MKLAGVRLAETVGGDPAGRRNVTLGVVQHLWRSPVPFVAFYPPEGVRVTERRVYSPAPPRLIDDTDYLAGVEAHKKSFARDLAGGMISSGSLPGYFQIPTDEGWYMVLDLVEKRLRMDDPWGVSTERELAGDLAPFVWSYRNSGFCVMTIYDKDIGALRDDLLFVAKREGLELRWGRRVA